MAPTSAYRASTGPHLPVVWKRDERPGPGPAFD